jgi:hypothetical protein
VEGPVFNAARIWWDRWQPAPPPPPEPEQTAEETEAGADPEVDSRAPVEASPR